MIDYNHEMESAKRAAHLAGDMLRKHFGKELIVDARSAHDIKLKIDKQCQQIICDALATDFPDYCFLGEEGGKGGEIEWIIDPLDGTVNYYYGLPLFCVSIALRVHGVLQLGCVYAPMTGELYTALRGKQAMLNEQPIHVSPRRQMAQAIVFIGHGTHDRSGEAGIRRFAHISSQVCKVRILGSAALSLGYIAAGKLDAYVEQSIHLWDFAAAQVILESAGGRLEFTPHTSDALTGAVLAYNGLLPIHEALEPSS